MRTVHEEINDEGQTLEIETVQSDESSEEEDIQVAPGVDRRYRVQEHNKYYYDDGQVEIVAEGVYELDADGNRLRMVKLTDYTAERVRSLYPNAAALRAKWSDPQQRAEIIASLEEKGISFDALAAVTHQPDADPLDLLCYIVFSTPLRTRRERANRLRREERDFFDKYKAEARAILESLLEMYAVHGVAQFTIPDALKVVPISNYGNVREIASMFGGVEQLREAVQQLQALLYAA